MLTKKYVLVLLILLGLLNASCNSEKKMDTEKFDWEESKTAAPGYPMEVYRGGLKLAGGGFRSLYGGLTTSGANGWGSIGSGWGGCKASLPNGVHVKWVSFAEDCVYEIDTAIDFDKIFTLFKKGYYAPLSGFRPPSKRNYYKINVGFVPGGVVVIWVFGAGRQIEIGRYQGHKITVPQSEIDQLEAPDNRLFKKEVRELRMKDVRVIPQAIQDAHKNKPIPFSRWDSISKRYAWKINLELPKHLKDKEVRNFFYNGEKEGLFGKEQTDRFEIEEILKANTLRKRAIPKRIILDWVDEHNLLEGSEMFFNEKEIFNAFEEVFKNNEEGSATLNVRVNTLGTNIAIKLVGNSKEVWLPSTKIKIYKQ